MAAASHHHAFEPSKGRLARLERNATNTFPNGIFAPRIITTKRGHRMMEEDITADSPPPPDTRPRKFRKLEPDPKDDVFSTPPIDSKIPIGKTCRTESALPTGNTPPPDPQYKLKRPPLAQPTHTQKKRERESRRASISDKTKPDVEQLKDRRAKLKGYETLSQPTLKAYFLYWKKLSLYTRYRALLSAETLHNWDDKQEKLRSSSYSEEFYEWFKIQIDEEKIHGRISKARGCNVHYSDLAQHQRLGDVCKELGWRSAEMEGFLDRFEGVGEICKKGVEEEGGERQRREDLAGLKEIFGKGEGSVREEFEGVIRWAGSGSGE